MVGSTRSPKSEPGLSWACRFGAVLVPASEVMPGVLRCTAPPQPQAGAVVLTVECSQAGTAMDGIPVEYQRCSNSVSFLYASEGVARGPGQPPGVQGPSTSTGTSKSGGGHVVVGAGLGEGKSKGMAGMCCLQEWQLQALLLVHISCTEQAWRGQESSGMAQPDTGRTNTAEGADPLLAGLDWVDQTVRAAESACTAAVGIPPATVALTVASGAQTLSESTQGGAAGAAAGGAAAAQAGGASILPSSNPTSGGQKSTPDRAFAVQSSLCQAAMNWALQAILPLWLELREEAALGTIETEGPKAPSALLALISQDLPPLGGPHRRGGEGGGEGEVKEGVAALGLHLLHLLAGLGWGWAMAPLRQAGMGPMEIDATDALGCTPLHWAAAHGRCGPVLDPARKPPSTGVLPTAGVLVPPGVPCSTACCLWSGYLTQAYLTQVCLFPIP